MLRMRIAAGKAFKAVEPLSQVTIDHWIVPGIGAPAIPLLKTRDWDETPAAFITLSLRADNSTIQAASFSALGVLEEVTFDPKKYFPAMAEDSRIRISGFDLSSLVFNADLVSNLTNWRDLDLTYMNGGGELTAEEYLAGGGGEFCLRTNVIPSCENRCKLNISIIPKPLLEAVNLNCSVSSLPSFLIKTKEIPILPPTKNLWGLGFLLLVVKGNPESELGKLDQFEMRQAVHSLMRQAVLSRFCKKLSTFQTAWTDLIKNGPTDPKKTLDWPELTDSTEQADANSAGEFTSININFVVGVFIGLFNVI